MLLMRIFYFMQPANGTAPKIQGPIYQPDQAQAGTSSRELVWMRRVAADLSLFTCLHFWPEGLRWTQC